MDREEFKNKLDGKSDSVKVRLLTEYDFYNKFDGTADEYIEMRMKSLRSNSRIFNRIYDINTMFKLCGEDPPCKAADVRWSSDLEKFYCTEEYLRTVKMNNPIDRFTLLFFFYGYVSSNDRSLCRLKHTDINLRKKEIVVEGVTHKLSDYDISLIKDVKKSVYYKTAKGEYRLPNVSPYFVQKIRSHKQDTPCRYSTIKTRLEKINEELGTKFSRYSLKISGIASKLYAIDSEKDYWKPYMIRAWKETEYKDSFSVADVAMVLQELYYKP